MPSRTTPREKAYAALRKILYRWAAPMDVAVDEPEHYGLDTRHVMKNKKALQFGSVRVRKTYVSFHLMPIYVNPELMADASDQIKKRQQGKSCFNFNAPDDRLFAELAALVQAGYQDYVRRGYIG
ncbi:MAG: hypothetical protein AB8G16_18190 [Gammaproteobacteria bacterium]